MEIQEQSYQYNTTVLVYYLLAFSDLDFLGRRYCQSSEDTFARSQAIWIFMHATLLSNTIAICVRVGAASVKKRPAYYKTGPEEIGWRGLKPIYLVASPSLGPRKLLAFLGSFWRVVTRPYQTVPHSQASYRLLLASLQFIALAAVAIYDFYTLYNLLQYGTLKLAGTLSISWSECYLFRICLNLTRGAFMAIEQHSADTP